MLYANSNGLNTPYFGQAFNPLQGGGQAFSPLQGGGGQAFNPLQGGGGQAFNPLQGGGGQAFNPLQGGGAIGNLWSAPQQQHPLLSGSWLQQPQQQASQHSLQALQQFAQQQYLVAQQLAQQAAAQQAAAQHAYQQAVHAQQVVQNQIGSNAAMGALPSGQNAGFAGQSPGAFGGQVTNWPQQGGFAQPTLQQLGQQIALQQLLAQQQQAALQQATAQGLMGHGNPLGGQFGLLPGQLGPQLMGGISTLH